MRRQPHGPMWKNRIVGHGKEKPDQLLANPSNWRIHGEDQLNELEKVLEKVGWVQQVVVNQRTQHVVDGHARVALALRRDEEEVPVLYIDVPPSEEQLILAVLDPLSAMAGRDEDKLEELKLDVIQAYPMTDIEMDVDLDTILAPRRKERTQGLTHEVNECVCCKKKCKEGCGCFRGEES